MIGFRILSAALVGAVVVVSVSYVRDETTLATKQFEFVSSPTFGLDQALAEIRADLRQFVRSEAAAAMLRAFEASAAGSAVMPLTPPADKPPAE